MKSLLFLTIALIVPLCGCNRHPQSAEETEPSKPPATTVEQRSTPQKEADLRDAAQNGYIRNVIDLLDQGVDVNAPGEENRTALMLAAFGGYDEIVKRLLARGAEVNVRDAVERTALMYAASGPNLATVRLLLAHGAKTNLVDNHEAWTALMFAAAEGQTEIVQALLDAGADPNLIDTDGDTAYDFAMQRGQAEAARLLEPAEH